MFDLFEVWVKFSFLVLDAHCVTEEGVGEAASSF